jgi:hypothetical protein
MRTKRSWAIGTLTVALLAAGVACCSAGLWFEYRKHELSGVPAHHFALDVDGQKFHVPRGGGPVEQRPQVPMTEEQYQLWQENENLGSNWGLTGVLCWMAGVTIGAVAGQLRRRRDAAPPRPPKQAAETPGGCTAHPLAAASASDPRR